MRRLLPFIGATVSLDLAIVALGLACPPASAADLPTAGRLAMPRATFRACRIDARRLCDGVQPGGGRIIRCLADNIDILSPDCRWVLQEARALIGAKGD